MSKKHTGLGSFIAMVVDLTVIRSKVISTKNWDENETQHTAIGCTQQCGTQQLVARQAVIP